MNNKKNFYDTYHRKNDDFTKVISDNNATYFYILPILKKALSKLSKNNIEAIDVGCGVGTIAFYLAEKKVKVDGFDVSSRAINLCNRYKKISGEKNARFYNLDIEKLNIKSKYQLIVCTEVIEHLKNDERFVKKLSSICQTNGYLILSTPSQNAPLYKLGMLDDFDKQVGHIRRYNETNLIKIIEDNGFKVIEIKKVEGILRNSLFTFKHLGFLLKFLKGPITPFFHAFDKLSAYLFGESDLIILARKK